MNVTEKQVRDYLIRRARQRREPVLYSELAARFGQVIRHEGDVRRWSKLLDTISTKEAAEKRPLLSVLVISKERNRPGAGFYKMARESGRYAGRGQNAEIDFYLAELKALYAYWETFPTATLGGVTVSEKAVREAMAAFDAAYPDSNGYERWLERPSYQDALVYGGRFYPPKHIVSQASGLPTSQFSGGAQTKALLAALGFTVMAKPLRRDFETYLLTWNPEKSHEHLESVAEQVYMGMRPRLRWSCGNTQRIAVGDRVYLMRLGPVLETGLVTAGWVTQAPQEAAHWGGEVGKTTLYVTFEPEVVLRPGAEALLDPLTVSETFNWRPQRSGVTIPKELAARLDEAWRAHVTGSSTQLDEESSIGPLDSLHEPSPPYYVEGEKKRVVGYRYERDPQARAACIAHYGAICQACGFDFGAVYGALGRGYIQVHHRHPLAEQGGAYVVDPIADLVPLCGNCHAMVHRGAKVISVEALREILDSGR